MKKVGAFVIFLALVASEFLDIDLSLAPGLSLKNLLLYVVVLWIIFEGVLDSSGGGILKRQFDYMSLHAAFIISIIVALFSAAVCVFIIDYEDYGAAYAIIYLKSSLIDRYLMLFVFLAAIRDSKEAVWMVKAMLFTITAAMVLSLIDMFEILDLRIMDPRADGRLQGFRLGSNEYGALMAFYMPIALALAYQAKGKWRAFWGVSTFILFTVMIFSASRGALLGLAGGAVLGLALFSPYIDARSVAKSLVVVTVIAFLTVALLSIQYGDLLYTRFVETTMTSNTFDQTSGRTAIWGDALRLMSATPITFLFGFGWGTFNVLNELGSHNTYFEFLFELGLIGLSLVLFILLNIVYQTRLAARYANAETRLILIGFGFGYLSILVSTTLNHMSAPWLFIWGMAGAVLRLTQAKRVEIEKPPVVAESDQRMRSPLRHGNGRTT